MKGQSSENNGIFVVVLDQIDGFISWELCGVCFGLQHLLAWVMIQIKLRENLALVNKSYFLDKHLPEETFPGVDIWEINNTTPTTYN